MTTVTRNTKQRVQVFAALSAANDFVSAQSLHALLGEDAPSLATVYRSLQFLVQEGDADTVTRNGESLYRACGTAHHHHLVCTECATTVEVDGGEIEEWAARTAREHGFVIDSHIADIYGRCTACSA
jgi:Fur family ferric uptake transcriptional regulator